MSSKGRLAYVTGGMGGIGTAISRRLCREGFRVFAGCGPGSRRKDPWVAEMRAQGFDVHASEGNVADWESTRAAFEKVRNELGPVDVLVNNAGITRDTMFHKMTKQQWDEVIGTNLNGLFNVTRPCWEGMRARKFGRVINISSVRASLGINAGYSAYVAAKGAVSSLTRQWATEWAKHGITVNAIAPTFVDTPQVAMLLDDPVFKANIVSRIPLGRVGGTSDLAGAALFFASDASSFVTGQILGIDGGLTATQ